MTHAARIDKKDSSYYSINYGFPAGNGVSNTFSQNPPIATMNQSFVRNNNDSQPRLMAPQEPLHPPPPFQPYQQALQHHSRQASTSSPALYQQNQSMINTHLQHQVFIPQRHSSIITAPPLPVSNSIYTHMSKIEKPSISSSARSSAVASNSSSIYEGRPPLMPPPLYTNTNKPFVNLAFHTNPSELFRQIEKSILASINLTNQINLIAEQLSSLVSEVPTSDQNVLHLTEPRNKFYITHPNLFTFLNSISPLKLEEIIESTKLANEAMLNWKQWLVEQSQILPSDYKTYKDTLKSTKNPYINESIRTPNFNGRRMSQIHNMAHEISPTNSHKTLEIRNPESIRKFTKHDEDLNATILPFKHFNIDSKSQKQPSLRRKSTDDSLKLKKKQSAATKIIRGNKSHFKSNSSGTNNLMLEEENAPTLENEYEETSSSNTKARVSSTTGEHISFRVKPQILTEKGVKVAEQIRPPKRGAQGQLHPELSAKKDLFCSQCGTKDTPEWRKGPLGARTLCNACGLYLAKLYKKMDQEEADEYFLSKKDEKFKRS